MTSDFPETPKHGDVHSAPDGSCWTYNGTCGFWITGDGHQIVLRRPARNAFTGDVEVNGRTLSFENGILTSSSS